MNHTTTQRGLATTWKTRTSTLPPAAQLPAPYSGRSGPDYPFCLPAAYADHNLLPEVRDEALALFAELGIPWHAGISGGPGNHLLSSQVQCVNALTQMVRDPSRITRAFGSVVDIADVLEVEPGRYLTFEYVGPTDYFGEAPGATRIRGAHCTSVDAAFLVRSSDGLTELVLVEWKYTEAYGLRNADPARDAVRLNRYGAALADPSGPVRDDLLSFEHLVDEPFYQLVRQQLLAHALEEAGVADRVRVVHVLAPENAAYQASLVRDEHRALGSTVSEVWGRLLRRPERFSSLDPAVFLDRETTSGEYVARYAPDVVWDQAGLFAAYGVEDGDGFADVFGWDGDVDVLPSGVLLGLGRDNLGLEFPFRVAELDALAEEVESAWT